MTEFFRLLSSPNAIRQDFDLIGALREVDGPILEVGGPTLDYEWPLVNVPELRRELGRMVTVSNILQEAGVQARMDVHTLPVKDNMLAGIMAASLPVYIRDDFVNEGWRVLRPGGYIMENTALVEDISYMIMRGFRLKGFAEQLNHNGRPSGLYNVIAQKPVET